MYALAALGFLLWRLTDSRLSIRDHDHFHDEDIVQ